MNGVPTILDLTVDVRSLPNLGQRVRHEATAEERQRVAEHCGVEAIERLAVEVLVEPWRKGGVRVVGEGDAALTQACVVTLDPVEAELRFPIEGTYVPDGSSLAAATLGEVVLDPEGADPPEIFDGRTIQLGSLVVELLSLIMDPYPRAPGAALPDEARDEGIAKPLAALAALRTKE